MSEDKNRLVSRPLTVADVEALPAHQDEDGDLADAVLVDRGELIATARAFQSAMANYRFMVERAADLRLEGYRELAAKAARAEEERDELRREVERRDALLRSDGYEDMRAHAAELAREIEQAREHRNWLRAAVMALVADWDSYTHEHNENACSRKDCCDEPDDEDGCDWHDEPCPPCECGMEATEELFARVRALLEVVP